MNHDSALTAFGALAHRDRLAVLRRLVEAGPEGMTAGEIAKAIGASPSRASFHLSALSEAGLTTSERQLRQVRYRVRFEAIGGLIQYLLQDCCGGHPTVRACCDPAD